MALNPQKDNVMRTAIETEPHTYMIEPDSYGWVVWDEYYELAIAAFKRHQDALAWAEKYYSE